MQFRRMAIAACSMATASLLCATPAMAATVTVKPGDSLWKIAHRYHVSLASVERANPTVDPLNLQIGYQVQLPYAPVPKSGTRTAGKATAAGSSSSSAAKSTSAGTPAAKATAAPRTVSAKPAASGVTASNLYWMARVIHAEAGAEPMDTKIAVGNVVMHRLQKAGTSRVKDVVFAVEGGHYQFTSVANGYIYTEPDPDSVRAARTVLARQRDVVPGALVFYNPAETPDGSWVWDQPVIRKIGHLVFAK
ncbi:MAG: cell wall hydrolase [Alicyclobacillus sp.]|nr:cell wall hydrolase [Alicyclobacillus sp.]